MWPHKRFDLVFDDFTLDRRKIYTVQWFNIYPVGEKRKKKREWEKENKRKRKSERVARCFVNKTLGTRRVCCAIRARINGTKLSGRKKSSEIRELSYANYGRIVARLTPFREGTRFALSVSPLVEARRRPRRRSRVTHKRFLVFRPRRGHLVELTGPPPSGRGIDVPRWSTFDNSNTLTKPGKAILSIELDTYSSLPPPSLSLILRFILLHFPSLSLLFFPRVSSRSREDSPKGIYRRLAGKTR